MWFYECDVTLSVQKVPKKSRDTQDVPTNDTTEMHSQREGVSLREGKRDLMAHLLITAAYATCVKKVLTVYSYYKLG